MNQAVIREPEAAAASTGAGASPAYSAPPPIGARLTGIELTPRGSLGFAVAARPLRRGTTLSNVLRVARVGGDRRGFAT